MKTPVRSGPVAAAPIVQLLDDDNVTPDAVAATEQRARAFAEPLIGESELDTGENVLAHADAVAEILASIGAAPSLRAAAYLVYAADHLGKPDEVIAKAFGD